MAAWPVDAVPIAIGQAVERGVLSPDDIIARPSELEFSRQVIARPKAAVAPDDLQPGKAASPTASVQRAAGRGTSNASLVKSLRLSVISEVASTGELVVRVPEGIDDAAYVQQLRATGQFQYVTPDWLCFPAEAPNDPLFSLQWQHVAAQSVAAWPIGMGAPTTIVAIVDSGIDLWQPDLAGNIVTPGHNSVSQPASAPPTGAYSDISAQSHGTRCAGFVNALANNAQGGTGIAPGVKVLPVRCTNSPSGSALLSDILNGAEWAARNGAKVVSVSFSGVTSPSVGARGTVIRALNAMLVFAAGNSNSELSGAADWPDVLIVGAIDRSDSRYTLSNFGSPIDVCAPGVDVLTTSANNQYAIVSGTSYATPQVAAVAAMIWSAGPQLQSYDVEGALVGSCVDIGPLGKDVDFGYGRINSLRALKRITGQWTGTLTALPEVPSWPGLTARYYDLSGGVTALPESQLVPTRVAQGVAQLDFPDGSLSTPVEEEGFAVTFSGALVVPTSNIYTLGLSSVDGSALYIDGLMLINNDGLHDQQLRTGSVVLQAGAHDLLVRYFSHAQDGGVSLSYRQVSGAMTPVPASWYARNIAPADVLDIADFYGNAGHNGLVDEGDYNLFFQGFFSNDPLEFMHADIANDAGNPIPDGHVNEGDYNAFFFWFFRP